MSRLMPADVGTLPAPRTEAAPARASRAVVTAGFVILALSYMVNAMDRQVFFPLLPNIRTEYGFSLPAGGFLATGFTLGMAVAGVPAGFLLARRSRKQVLIASIVVYSLGTLATPLAVGYTDMMAYRIVSGLGEGASEPRSASAPSSARSSACTWPRPRTPGARRSCCSEAAGWSSR